MRLRTVLATSLTAVVAAGALAPALAAPPKPVSKSYQASAAMVDPTPITGETGGNCSPVLEQAKHEAPFTMPFAGTLQVDLTKFQGDWALAVLDSKGKKIADHDNDVIAGEAVDAPSQIIIKLKKKTDLVIRACNFAGGPTAQVDILATPKK
jgi:hypothetical protein